MTVSLRKAKIDEYLGVFLIGGWFLCTVSVDRVIVEYHHH